MAEKVVIVDERNVSLGTCDKVIAHQCCRLHRAFSVFLYNSTGRWLLQKRSKAKYHSGGLWSNTCCGHPSDLQSTRQSASERLMHEMGIDCFLEEVCVFMYKCKLDNGMWEHEFDHVLTGTYDGLPNPNQEEVEDWVWSTQEQIGLWIQEEPEAFTYWFKCLFPRLRDHS